MKKVFYLLFAAFCFAACLEEELSPAFQSDSNVLYASMESVDATKTSMDEYNNVLWSENDQLVAFMKTTLGIRYQIKEQYVGTTTGGFSKVQGSGSGDDLESGQEIDHNVVVYPYSDQVWCMKYDNSTPAKAYKLNVVLPQTQTYAENSFANGAFPMVAVSSNNQLTFKNICGGLKLQFKGVDKIRSIKLEGLADEKISGKSSVVAYSDGNTPVITMASTASTSVTLDCGEGVQLNETTPTTFIIAVPPTEFKSGMKITVTDSDGLSKTLTNTSANTIKRSSLLNFPVITYKQNGVLELSDGALTSYEVSVEGGTVEIPVITNQDYQVAISEDGKEWISVVETKALREEVITLSVAPNSMTAIRSAQVNITDAKGTIFHTITISQAAASSDIDDSDFNEDLYLRYVSNSYYEGSGGAFDYNMYYYSSYIYNYAFAISSKVEYKFQLASRPESSCYLSAIERDDSVYSIYFNENALFIGYDSYSWETLGVDPTDVIVLSFDGNIMTINGNTFTLNSIRRGGYIFSGYYYDSDDGVYSKYYSFQDGAKLFYAKGWDADGKLIYLGGPTVSVGPSGSDEACWKSVYHYNNKISTQYDFAYYTDQQEYTPYGFGNLLGPEEEIPTSPANNEIWYTSSDGAVVDPRYAEVFGATIISNTYENGKGVIRFDGPVTSIGEYAFYQSGRLTSITIPEEVTSIENGAFCKCYSLAEFKGKYAEDNGRILVVDGVLAAFAPSGLSEYAIPDGVTTIGYEAFRECDNLTKITISNSVTIIDGHAFQNCDNITEITIPDSVTSIGEYAFDYCHALSDVNLGNGVNVIKYVAFCGCESLTSIIIPDSVTELGSEVFYGCSNLKSVTLGKGLTSIANTLFWRCTSLTDIIIPNGIKSIGARAFDSCSSLSSITIPESITSIGQMAFTECSGLKEVYCQGTTPPSGGQNMFSYNAGWTGSGYKYKPLDCKIYVPAQSVNAYKNTVWWSDYAGIIYAMPAGMDVVNLSESGSANSYIVSEAGSHCCPVKVPDDYYKV